MPQGPPISQHCFSVCERGARPVGQTGVRGDLEARLGDPAPHAGTMGVETDCDVGLWGGLDTDRNSPRWGCPCWGCWPQGRSTPGDSSGAASEEHCKAHIGPPPIHITGWMWPSEAGRDRDPRAAGHTGSRPPRSVASTHGAPSTGVGGGQLRNLQAMRRCAVRWGDSDPAWRAAGDT